MKPKNMASLWQKIKRNHFLLMVLCCAVPIILIIGFFALFKGGRDYWVWLIILLCPLMHIWMMKGHKHDDSCERKEVDGEEKKDE